MGRKSICDPGSKDKSLWESALTPGTKSARGPQQVLWGNTEMGVFLPLGSQEEGMQNLHSRSRPGEAA